MFLGSDVLPAKLVATPLGVQLLLPPMPAPLDMLCVGKWPQQKVAQHGRVLERSRFKWNPGSSARDSFFQSNDFVKGADGLWHLRVEADRPVVKSVWSQGTVFPEVELRLFHKGDWRVVISQKWKFEDDILSREARALFRGLQVMVCAERVSPCF